MNRQIGKKLLLILCIVSMILTCACGKVNKDEPVKDTGKEVTQSGDASKNAEQGKTGDVTAPDNTEKTNTEGNAAEGQNQNGGTGINQIIEENNKVDVAFTYAGKSYGFRPNVRAYLIMGVDRYGEVQKSDSYIGTGQCDAIYLLALDHDRSKYTILQLDRDAMVEMNILGVFGDVVGTEVQQLALAHAYGDGEELSCQNCLNAVSKWLNGVPISGYAALQFDALPIINDDIGGVAVYIEDDWSSIDKTLKKGTTVKLMGQHALNYVHARCNISDGYNESRMRRHRTYLNSFMDQFRLKLKEGSDIINIIYSDVKPYMCTDMSVGTISNIAGKAMDYEFAGIQTIKGLTHIETYNSGVSLMEFWPDEASLNETVISLFCKEVK